jgi:hypothetical protein
VTIPNNVTSIGDRAFFGCEGLTSVILPASVTHIGKWTFRACRSLTSVMIPDSVTHIGEEAFVGCDKVTLHVQEGSAAAKYAQEHQIPYMYVE